MIPTRPDEIAPLLRETVTDPQGVARRMAQWRAPRAVLWQALIAVVLINVLLLQVENLIRPFPVDPFGPLFQNPLVFGVAQAGFAVLTVFGAYWIGHMFGGTGRFDSTIIFLTWLQIVASAIQLLQVVLLLVVPSLYDLAGMIGFALSLWLFVNFVAVLHGFSSLGKVFAGLIGTLLAVALIFVVVLNLIGVVPPPGS